MRTCGCFNTNGISYRCPKHELQTFYWPFGTTLNTMFWIIVVPVLIAIIALLVGLSLS